MRKLLITFFLLLTLSVSVLVIGHRTVDSLQDQITVTETVLDGDPAAAQGLTVTLDTDCEGQLFWHTTYEIGADPTQDSLPTADFSFSAVPVNSPVSISDFLFLEFGSVYYHANGNLRMEDLSDSFDPDDSLGASIMMAPAADLAARTLPGETSSETVNLCDYYSYYPIGLQYRTGGTFGTQLSIDPGFRDTLTRYFRIPVSEEIQVTVSISKDEADNIRSASCDLAAGSIPINNGGIVTEEGFYLILWTKDPADADLVSHIAGGYGVYFIPVQQSEDDLSPVVSDRIRNICSMDPEAAQAVYLAESQDRTKLFLFTREEDQLVMTVLQKETWEPLQHLILPPGQIQTVTAKDDTLILRIWDGTSSRMLVINNEEGAYSVWLDTVMGDVQNLTSNDICDFCFDGERLAVAFYVFDSASFRLQVYDRSGLLYEGQYDHTGDSAVFRMAVGWNDRRLALEWE